MTATERIERIVITDDDLESRWTIANEVCQVCQALKRPDCVDTHRVDVSERFGLDRHVFFEIVYCRHNRVCRETAQQIAEQFAAGDDAAARMLTTLKSFGQAMQEEPQPAA